MRRLLRDKYTVTFEKQTALHKLPLRHMLTVLLLVHTFMLQHVKMKQ